MSDETDVFTELPVRARVATVLCTLQRILPVLSCNAPIADQVRDGIELAWRWEMAENVSGHALYKLLEPLNESLSNMYSEQKLDADRQLLALLAVVYGLYYVCWEAVNQEVAKLGMQHFLTYPNDLADVTDEHMLKSLEYGAKSLGNIADEIEWHRRLALRLSSRRNDAGDYLGIVIRPEECRDCA